MTQADSQESFLWYDLETSGIDPRWDRIMQFAGIRTDAALDETGEELSTYVKLPIDVLPDPGACRVTGLSPQRVNREGLDELHAFFEIEQCLSRPRSCVAGFNNLRFDDEFIRYGLYRQLFDPYGREWQGGNSRWDIIDLARAAAALRPDGIEWPQKEGMPEFRLEALAAANGITHGEAHDALSDVRATIALARLLRRRQPRLFEYYLGLRSKAAVLALLRPERPEVRLHVSGRVAPERHCIAPVMPLARHPRNRNAVIVVDLLGEIEPLFELDATQLAERLFARAGAAPQGDGVRPGIKEVRANRCPFVAPLSALRREDRRRLGWDLTLIEDRFARLRGTPGLAEKAAALYGDGVRDEPGDVDAGLYRGFVDDADRALCREVVMDLREGRAIAQPPFHDARLGELLFRLRARNFESQLSAQEHDRWRAFVREKLYPQGEVPWLSLPRYRESVAAAREAGTRAQQRLLEELAAHGEAVERWLAEP